MIEEVVNGDSILYFVDDRKASTLAPLIAKHIEPGTDVHTDGWKAYQSIDWKGMAL
jgi:transposase-like protein